MFHLQDDPFVNTSILHSKYSLLSFASSSLKKLLKVYETEFILLLNPVKSILSYAQPFNLLSIGTTAEWLVITMSVLSK